MVTRIIGTKFYSFDNGNLTKYINNSCRYIINNLLTWFNKNNNKYYLIQCSYKTILLSDLDESGKNNNFDIDFQFKSKYKNGFFSGFIYTDTNIDYLCASSSDGFIDIWNLNNKTLFKSILINNSSLYHIINWNNNFIIVADYKNHSFKIIDLKINKVISNMKYNKIPFRCIKKVNHPIYGESLLAAGYRYIILFTLNNSN